MLNANAVNRILYVRNSIQMIFAIKIETCEISAQMIDTEDQLNTEY